VLRVVLKDLWLDVWELNALTSSTLADDDDDDDEQNVLKNIVKNLWLHNSSRHYDTSRKVSGSSPDEVDFINWPNPSGRTSPGVDSASNRNEYQESLKIKKLGGKVRPALRADNLAAIY
jgi:hypothetical protein